MLCILGKIHLFIDSLSCYWLTQQSDAINWYLISFVVRMIDCINLQRLVFPCLDNSTKKSKYSNNVTVLCNVNVYKMYVRARAHVFAIAHFTPLPVYMCVCVLHA